ncbi:NUDIX domain-containing protein [Albirhodobacter sp. R86504]|uniref:NUDIX domain-containing protein n=1 Tax=Albirhodobacter sp. R86504 TaxID=3093848 RepID=UPI0036733754
MAMSAVSQDVLLSGWLADPSLRAIVFAQAEVGPAEAISLSGYAVQGDVIPAIVAQTGSSCPAIKVSGSAQVIERLEYLSGGGQAVSVGGLPARAYLGAGLPEQCDSDAPWDLASALSRHGALIRDAITRHMDGLGDVDAAQAQARWPMVLVRASSSLRARSQEAPAELRRRARPDDVELRRVSQGYTKFFAVEDYVLAHRRFTGGMSAEISRAAFISGDAVVILPYDPARDQVLLVEQFRAGLFARGDLNPWSLEGVAGRIDAGETPQEAGRREGEEEAGVTFSDLLQAPSYYPSPGAKAEFLYNFVGLCDLSILPSGGGGLEEEGEDIRSHIISFDRMMALIASGEINNGPLVVLAYWLALERDKIRANAATRERCPFPAQP